MPHVTKVEGTKDNPIYQVGQKSFVFFRNARADASDPETGERYDDVIVIWVASEDDKQALVQDEGSPYFTTPHFDGHPSVLLRGSRIGEIDRRRADRAGAGCLALPGLTASGRDLARREVTAR